MEQKIFDIIFQGDEVTWQSLIQDLVRVENMDPWDIDISKLSQKYIEMLKKMQELDLRISGKVVLAAAILLRMKSNYLMDNDMLNFDKMMHPENFEEEALYDDQKQAPTINSKDLKLIPRTPQPRKRKVSIFELVEALKQALEVKNRRRQILDAVNIPLPEKKIDIFKVIEQLYNQIEKILGKQEKLTFNELVPSKKREDMIGAFVPMLHLSNDHKVDLEQFSHFGDIHISLHDPNKPKQASALNKQPDLTEEFDFLEEGLKEASKKRRKK